MKLRPILDRLENRQMLDASQALTSPPRLPEDTSRLSPEELRDYYGIDTVQAGDTTARQPSDDGKGQTIVVITYSGDRDQTFVGTDSKQWMGSGLYLYDRAIDPSGRNRFTFTMVNQNNDDGNKDPVGVLGPAATGRAGEFDMDIEAVHLMAPDANIVDVVINSLVKNPNSSGTAYTDALNTALKYTPAAITSSYASVETGPASTDGYVDGNGTTYVQSAGDSGGGQQLGYPNNSTTFGQVGDITVPGHKPINSINNLTVMVGGTRLTRNDDGSFSDVAWGQGESTYLGRLDAKLRYDRYGVEPGGGSGGGYSLFNPRPDYQIESPAVNANQGLFPTESEGKRLGPDVSMISEPGIEVLGYVPKSHKEGWFGNGGTSLSAPLFAGVMGVVDQRRVQAGLDPLSSSDTLHFLYQAPESDFNDIVSGNNGYPALPGFDLASGRGAVQAGLIGYLVHATYPTKVTVSVGTPDPAKGLTTLTAQVTAKLSGRVPAGSVTFYAGGKAVGTSKVNDQGVATDTIPTTALGSAPVAVQFVAS